MAGELDLDSILKLGGFGGAVAAVVNVGLKHLADAWTERRKKTSEATYAALRSAIIFEAFASACDSHHRDRDVDHQKGRDQQAGVLPKLDEFPTNIDWRAFDTELANEVLGFATRIDMAQRGGFREAWESDNFWSSSSDAVALGLAAWDIAVRIRATYGLGENQLMKPVAEGLYALDQAQKARSASAKASAAAWQALRGSP